MNRRLLARALLVLALLATPARADHRVEFRQGYQAFERKRWSEVESRMSAAIREREVEDARELIRLTGTFSKAYVPWFYLGAARYELGRWAEALEALDRSESQGAIRGLREYSDLVRMRDECRQRLAAALAASPPVPLDRPTAVPTVEVLRPEASLDPTPVPVERVPSALAEAARSYFAGDYRGCLSRLAAVAGPSRRIGAEVELFRAAAEFALARGGDPEAPRRLEAAREAAQRFRSTAGVVPPGESYFSPEFLAFLSGD